MCAKKYIFGILVCVLVKMVHTQEVFIDDSPITCDGITEKTKTNLTQTIKTKTILTKTIH